MPLLRLHAPKPRKSSALNQKMRFG
jgi:hypothetical protein